MLGHKVCQCLSEHDVIGMVRAAPDDYREYGDLFAGVELVGGVDVLESRQLEDALEAARPDFVVNCIGLVKQLDEADDPYLAVGINSFLPHRLARSCARLGARLVHISTDCVFDGKRGAYRETDPPDAEDLYGRSKALGETGPGQRSAVTLRTSFIGRELKTHTHGLLEWFLAQNGGPVNGFAGVIYNGLTSLELARVIRRIVERHPDLFGLYNVASAPISKYDLLALVRQIYGLSVEIRRADEPVSDRSLTRDAFLEATGYSAPSWSEMILDLYQDPTPYGAWQTVGEIQA